MQAWRLRDKFKLIKQLYSALSFKLSTWAPLKTFCLLLAMLAFSQVFSQDTLTENAPDTLLVRADTLLPENDSLPADTSKAKGISQSAMDAKVEYQAKDSIRFDVRTQQVYMYREAEIHYEEINLNAAYVEVDFKKSLAFAKGLEDSTGQIYGDPVFEESGQSYKSKSMKYNYNTKKGIIQKVFTEDGEGYLHGEVIKKMEDGDINIKSGQYTTCNLEEHPHFAFRYYKSKVIPGEKIITGPAFLEIEEVPTPLFIPFGLFPNQTGQRSGIVIPTYGESADRGFYFENGGYYWAINDYLDLKLVGDIYTRGSWAVKPSMNYRKRYKYSGNINLTYAINKVGVEGSQDFRESKDFAIRWSHSQDPKARPNSRFSANVNIVSNQYNVFNPTTSQDYLSNTFASSVTYQTNFNQKYFLTVGANHSQNTLNKSVSMTLPEVSFNINRFYPLERKKRAGSKKWYENISVNYSMNAKNSIEVADSLLFQPGWENKFRNGVRHSIPVSSTVKVLKYFNLTNSVNFTDRMYFETIRKYYVNDTLFQGNDTLVGYVETDTVGGFRNAFDFSLSSSITTKLYGMLAFRKGPIRAIRHVLTPTVSFTYTPDFSDESWGYYQEYYNRDLDEMVPYSIFESGIYGSPPENKSGRVNFSLSNNLEIKVPSKKDTVTGTRKITLLDQFTLSASYDLAKDSLNWSKLNMSARTNLFKGVDLRYSSSWDPYITDSTGNRNIDRYEWDVNRRLFRLEQSRWNLGVRYSINSDMLKAKEKPEEGSENEFEQIQQNPEDYIDWSIPWDLSLNYTLTYSTGFDLINGEWEKREKTVQTISLNGSVKLTPKWTISANTNYDFEQGRLSYTSLNIYRDLHCWEMRFNWIPLGPRKSWNFAISVKSSMLQDLKLTKKKDFRDNYY